MTDRSLSCRSNYWLFARQSMSAVFFGVLVIAVLSVGALASKDAQAEYGDIVLNNFSDKNGIRPVIFPHWFHRMRFACKSCHSDIGFPFKAGGSGVDMMKIISGEYCGACHDGQTAWSVENCDLCHSAKPNTPTQVHNSVLRAPK